MSLEQFSQTSFQNRKQWMEINCNKISCSDLHADLLEVSDLTVSDLTVSNELSVLGPLSASGSMTVLGPSTVSDLTVTDDLNVGGSIAAAGEILSSNLSIGTGSTNKYTFPSNISLLPEQESIIVTKGSPSGDISPLVFKPKVYFSALYSYNLNINTLVGGNVANYIGSGTAGTLPTIVSNYGVTLNTTTGTYTIFVPGVYRVKLAMTVLNESTGDTYGGQIIYQLNGSTNNVTIWNCNVVSQWVSNYDYGYKTFSTGDTVRFVATCSENSGSNLGIFNYCVTFENI